MIGRCGDIRMTIENVVNVVSIIRSSVMEVPEVLVPFVPTYEVLMLDVKQTQPSELTKTGHPFGWLLTVLQKENASKEELTQALVAALSELDALDAEQTEQHRRAIIYLASLIYHRRPLPKNVRA